MPFSLASRPPRPRKSDDLFRSNPPNEFDQRPLDCSPTAYTHGYRQAAEHLVQTVLANRREGDFLIYPIVFLYRHHLELALKRIIDCVPWILKRDLTDCEKKHLGGHKLDLLWNDLEPIFVAVCEAVNWNKPDLADLEGARHYFGQLTTLDPYSMSFRYWKTKDGKPALPTSLNSLEIHHFSQMMGRLADFIEGLDAATTAAGEMLDLDSDMEAY
jgi:hypothetical protein